MNRRLLGLAVALPFVYFGIQLAAAPFYPGYSFLTRDASTLGSDGSTAPWIFNGGPLLVGTLELVTAAGRASWRQRVRRTKMQVAHEARGRRRVSDAVHPGGSRGGGRLHDGPLPRRPDRP